MDPKQSLNKLAPAKVPLDPDAHAQAGMIIASGAAVMKVVINRVEICAPHVAHTMHRLMDEVTNPHARQFNQLDYLGALLETSEKARDIMSAPTEPGKDTRKLNIGRGWPMASGSAWVNPQEAAQLAQAMQELAPIIKPVSQQVNHAFERAQISDMSRRWNLDLGTPEQALNYQKSQAQQKVLAAYSEAGSHSGHLRIEMDKQVVHSATHSSVDGNRRPAQPYNNS